MEIFKARLRRVGGSLGVLVPKDIVRKAHANEGDTIEFAVFHSGKANSRKLGRLAGSFPELKRFHREREDRF